VNIISETEYQKREFCKDVKCKYLKIQVLEALREECRKHCPHSAWKFHQWLQKNGYKIIKETK
jgi:hypothetical protein